MRWLFRLVPAASLALLVTNVSATLIPWVGGKLVYDTDRDITWVADANLCLTLNNCVNGDAFGGMLWNDAKQWAADLEYLGYTDWRLPTSLEVDGSGPCEAHINCSGSEMGHLFYTDLDGVAQVGLVNGSGPFNNIQSVRYWSSTAFNVGPIPIGAWQFDFTYGQQWFEAFGGTDDNLLAWAVRDGRPRGLPEPGTLGLLGLGLAGLLAMRQRRKNRTEEAR